ncbi:MAG: methionyl-tRNA formyltransferase [Candidatus Omnitrophota bacterium]|nr:methionyl-tRNA formyltransferase [Candidatus Omnitrophota bacterium]
MKIVFFGTSEFAMTVLHRLIDSKHKVLALVTQPDRQKGRRLKVSPPPTKVLAMTRDIPVYQPLDASGKDSAAYLKKPNADLFVVVAFGQILKKEILEIPKIFSVNIHSSILPKYRGAAPTNWAIINGDRTSGVTIIKMNEKMDAGDIILKKEMAIDPDDTNITLSERLATLGADALEETIELIESGRIKSVKQDDSAATLAPKLKKEDGLINWKEPAINIHNKVRGLLPWPGAYTHFKDKVLKILKTEVLESENDKGSSGEVVDIIRHKGIVVKTGEGCLLIKYVQIEAKRPFDTDAFLCGHKLELGYIFNDITCHP